MSSGLTATYSPEDNKLRLYATSRLPREVYLKVKAAGFKWAPKQELFVAPAWSPSREDLLIDLCGEVDAEDYSPEERSADRAERFAGYQSKRIAEAGELADRFESSDQVAGHQDARRAEMAADKLDRTRLKSVTQWSKAEYWQDRIDGVIRHAMFKSSASVRRGRILTIEADERKMQKRLAEAKASHAKWVAVRDCQDVEQQFKLAYAAANDYRSGGGYNNQHPRLPEVKTSLYSLLANERDPITGAEAAAMWLADNEEEPGTNNDYYCRWLSHYALRLTYERALLAEEGGSAADEEMVPGGFLKGHQIHKVSKSNVTGKVVSVHIMAPDRYDNGKMKLTKISVQRMAEGSYREPTAEELEQFNASTKERKAAEKAGKKPVPTLINPTLEDAERLQAIWNALGKAKHEASERERWSTFKPSAVVQLTQKEYSAYSKGTYTKFETRTIHIDGRLSRRHSNMWSSEGKKYDDSLPAELCKLRCRYGTGGDYYSPDSIVVITDKPQKSLAIQWEALKDVA